MQLISHKQGSPEWLALRRKGIGASEAPIIMQVSPYTTPYELWQRKTYGTEQKVNSSMQYGKDTEEAERHEFSKLLGVVFFPDMTFVSDERPWQIASLDGIDFDQKVMMEIKQANAVDHAMAKEGKVPKKYIPQVQHQWSVNEKAERHFYCSSHKGDRVIVEVKRDDAYIDEMLEAEQLFYDKQIVEGIPPITEDMMEHAAIIKLLDADIKRLEADKEMRKETLISLCNGKSFKGCGVVLTKAEYKGSVDYNAIPELIGVDLDKYRKPTTERWTLRVA